MAMKYVKLFYDWYDMLSGLTKEELGEMFEAIMRYGYDGTEIETTGVVARMFPFFKRNIDRNEEAYEKTVEKRREAGRKGGKAKQMLTNESKISKEQEQNKEEEKEDENNYDYKQQNQEKECDLKSDIRDKDWEEYWGDYAMDDYENEMDDDVEKINNFIIEKGLDCDGREFYEYYKKRNWEVGGKRIENWKGLLISWAKNRKCDELSISKAPTKRSSTFDVDDFFEAALNRKFVPPGSKE